MKLYLRRFKHDEPELCIDRENMSSLMAMNITKKDLESLKLEVELGTTVELTLLTKKEADWLKHIRNHASKHEWYDDMRSDYFDGEVGDMY